MKIVKMLEDKREVRAIYFVDVDGSCFFVGENCTKIMVYPEDGIYSQIPFIKG